MKSFFVKRDLISAVKKDAWIVWFGHGLTQKRTEVTGVWSMRPACMQQKASKKEIPVGEN